MRTRITHGEVLRGSPSGKRSNPTSQKYKSFHIAEKRKSGTWQVYFNIGPDAGTMKVFPTLAAAKQYIDNYPTRNPAGNSQVSVGGTKYEVIASQERADVGPRLREDWDRRGIVRMLALRRPRGSKSVAAHEYADGRIHIVTRLNPADEAAGGITATTIWVKPMGGKYKPWASVAADEIVAVIEHIQREHPDWRVVASDRLPRADNPADEAAALSAAFHGRPARVATEITELRAEHGYLADLGGMEELVVTEPGSRSRRGLPIRFGHDTRLGSNEDGTQLFLVGGDQAVDLAAIPWLRRDGAGGNGGNGAGKEKVLIGPVASITYYADKAHLDSGPGSYQHTFGEDGGEPPVLVYDTRNEELELVGGSYRVAVDAAGLSPGIVD